MLVKIEKSKRENKNNLFKISTLTAPLQHAGLKEFFIKEYLI